MILGYYPKKGSLLVKLFQLEPINTLNFNPNEVNHSQALIVISKHSPITLLRN